MQSSSQGQYQGYKGYQGYPYVNPTVTDVPTIDPETASRWANLPRRPVAQTSGQGRGNVGASTAGSSSQGAQRPGPARQPLPAKDDIDETPEVYIDLPAAGSEVSQSISSPGSEEPQFVQDTILYDPFENQRIVPKDDTRSMSSSESESSHSRMHLQQNSMQQRPNNLNLASPSGSSSQPSSSTRPPVPAFMSKESLVYAGDGSDGFPISPIPISQFPEPPPAYTEVATTPSPTEVVTEPPRTQVIVQDPSALVSHTGTSTYNRKTLTCPHCSVRVQTLVIREVGYMTHFIALIAVFLFFPLVIVVYCAYYFKHKNHYCPNCNRFIGYELPLYGERIHFVM